MSQAFAGVKYGEQKQDYIDGGAHQPLNLGNKRFYYSIPEQESVTGGLEALAGRDYPVTTIAPTDWTAAFTAVYHFDDSLLTNDPATLCGASCDMVTNTGSVAFTGAGIVGTNAAEFNGSNYLTCTDAQCGGAGKLEPPTNTYSASWGCFYNRDTDAQEQHIFEKGTGNTGWGMYTGFLFDETVCKAWNGSASSTDTLNSASPVNTDVFLGCVADSGANTLTNWSAGGFAASPTSLNGLVGPSSSDVTFSSATGSADFDGTIDECFYAQDLVLTAAQLCRICSCSISGEDCLCDGTDPTLYDNAGRNTTAACNTCTLPNCNSAAPSAETDPRDWESAFIAIWSMDQATTSNTNDTATTCGSACDLSTIGGTPDSAVGVENALATQYVAASNEYHSCADASCGGSTFLDVGARNFEFGCFYQQDLNNSATLAQKGGGRLTANEGGYELFFNTSLNTAECYVDSGAAQASDVGLAAWVPANGFRLAGCQWTDSSNQVLVYWSGGSLDAATTADFDGPGSPGSLAADIGSNALAFTISNDDPGADASGDIDLCFAIADNLTTTERVRIASCFIDGTHCTCDPALPGNYKACNNNTDCGGDSICDTGASALDDTFCIEGVLAGCCMGWNSTMGDGVAMPSCQTQGP